MKSDESNKLADIREALRKRHGYDAEAMAAAEERMARNGDHKGLRASYAKRLACFKKLLAPADKARAEWAIKNLKGE